MKKNNLIRQWIGLLCAIVFLTGCGSKQKGDYAESQSSDEKWDAEMEAAYDESGEMDGGGAPMEEELSGNAEIGSTGAQNQKLIKDVSISAETKKFDTLLESITKKTKELGGYVESSEINGSSYSYYSSRWAELMVRIPADKLDAFVKEVDSNANITNKMESVRDVTLEYVDIESHVNALRAEQESLLNILKKADKLGDIIKVQSQLTQVRYEIESYESQLRTYDNMVTYSTVKINITEVERETPAEPETFGDEIKARLEENLNNIKDGLRSFAIWFISSIPYIILWAVIILIICVPLWKAAKKERQKRGGKHRVKKQRNYKNKLEEKEEKETPKEKVQENIENQKEPENETGEPENNKYF